MINSLQIKQIRQLSPDKEKFIKSKTFFAALQRKKLILFFFYFHFIKSDC